MIKYQVITENFKADTQEVIAADYETYLFDTLEEAIEWAKGEEPSMCERNEALRRGEVIETSVNAGEWNEDLEMFEDGCESVKVFHWMEEE